MTKLDDFRRWLQGEEVDGLPLPWRKPASTPEHPAALDHERLLLEKQRVVKYIVTKDGTDAMLMFGRFKGQRLSQMTRSPEGMSYMQWMLTQSFPQELRDVVYHVLHNSLLT